MNTFIKKTALLSGALLLGVFTLPAHSDLIFNLGDGNSAISGYTGPYATVDVHLVDSTHATITFDSLTNNGNIYLMSDGGTVGVNVNGTLDTTLSSVSASCNGCTGFSPSGIAMASPGNEDGFGFFNTTYNSSNGFPSASSEVILNLVLASGSWASDTSVLTANPSGYLAAAHIFVTSDPAVQSNGALATGFAAGTGGNPNPNPNPTPAPEPTTVWMLGMGLLGLVGYKRRQSKLVA